MPIAGVLRAVAIAANALDPGQHGRGGGRAAQQRVQAAEPHRSLLPVRPGRGHRINPRITRQRVTTQAAPPGTLTASVNHQLRGVIPVRPHTYEITFSGQAGRTLRAQFDDCKVTTGPDTTILRAELPDQAALSGLVQRIAGLGLVVIDVHLVTPGSGP